MTQKPTKVPSHLDMPQPPPEGRPFEVGATTALVTRNDNETVTLRLKRTLCAPAERVYSAFVDPDALAAWLPPHGMVARTHEMDARVGGKFRVSFYTVNKSWSSTFSGRYLELVPGRRLVHTDSFESGDPSAPGELRVTIAFTPVEGGTTLDIEQAGIPVGPMANGAPYGWAQSLDKLAQLVEPELPF